MLGAAPWNAAFAGPSAPFNECPAVGPNTACKLLITVEDTGATEGDLYAAKVHRDPAQPYLNGGITSGEILVGIRNDTSAAAVATLQIQYPDDVHPYGGFCGQYYPPPPGNRCAQGDDYAGANVASTSFDATTDVLWVTFKPLMPGQQAFFAAPVSDVMIRPGWIDIGLPSYDSIDAEDLDGADDGLQALFRCYEGDPVNCANGSLVDEADDVNIPGRGANLHLTRTYSSIRAIHDTTMGRFGYGWDDSYARRLVVGSGTVDYVSGGGSTTTFTQAGGSYTAESYVLGSLVKNTDGSYRLLKRDGTVDHYSSTGLLTSITDRNGYATALGYTSGLLTWVEDEAGRRLTFNYNADGTVASITRPDTRVVSYGYTAGNLTSVVTPGNRTTRYTYNSSNGMTVRQRPDGGQFATTLDGQGRVLSQVDPVGRTTTWSYLRPAGAPTDSLAVTTTLTRPNGRTDAYVFDAWARLLSKSVGANTPSPRVWRYHYDANTGQRTDVMNPLGDFLQVSVDDRGNQTQQVDQDGRIWNWTYDANNNVTSYTDPRGVTTRWSYDANGNTLAQTQPLNDTTDAITRYYYGNAAHPGDVTRVVDPNGDASTASWTVNGGLAAVTDTDGNTTRSTYDILGRLRTLATPVQYAAGTKSTYVYNAAGDLATVTHASGGSATYTYDPMGRVTSHTDADGYVTTNIYNKVGEITRITKPGGQQVNQTWDSMGNMTGQDNGRSPLTWTYNQFGDATRATDPNGSTTFGYDAAGNRTTLTDPLGRSTTWTYDPQGRPTSVSYSDDAARNVTYAYGSNGRLVKMTDYTGVSTWTYDLAGRVTSQTSPSAGTVGYTYDNAGNTIGLTYPDGQTATRTYNHRGQMTSLSFGSGQALIEAGFTYDPDGNLTQIAYPDGTASTRAYDFDGRVTSIKDTLNGQTLLNAPYSYSNGGTVTGFNLTPAVTAVNDSTAALSMTSVERGTDARVNRVTGIGNLASTTIERYEYSPTGDLTKRVNGSLTLDAGSRDLTYSSDGQRLVSQTVSVAAQPGSTTSFGYNQFGSRTSSTTTVPTLTGTNTVAETRFHYDQAGHLTGFDGAPLMLVNKSATDLLSQALQDEVDFDLHLAYRYDGLGRLAGVAYDSTVTETPGIITDGVHNFIRGPGGMPIAQTVSLNVINVGPGGNVETNLAIDGTKLNPTLRAALDTLPPLILHTDRQNSVRLVTTKQGAPIAALSYDSYGAATVTSINDVDGLDASDLLLPLRYTGAYTDVMSGLTYLYNRWYDPHTAQFITIDPALTATNDPYAYTSGDPLTRTDPFGLDDKHRESWWSVYGPPVITFGVIVTCVVFPESCLLATGIGAGLQAGIHVYERGADAYRYIAKDLLLTVLTLGLASQSKTLAEAIRALPAVTRLAFRLMFQIPNGVSIAGWVQANC